MTTPLLRIIRKYASEQIEIHLLTNKIGKEILENNPYVDNLILKENKSIKEYFRLSKIVNSIKPDYVFLFRTTFFNILLAYFSKAKKTSGLNKELASFLLTSTINDDIKKNYRHQCLSIINLIYPFNNIQNNELLGIDVFLTKKEEKYSEEFLKQKNLNNKIVIIHPGTTRFAKQWTPQNYSIVLDMLLSKGYNVIITGTKQEQEIGQKILGFSKTKNAILVFNSSIRELAGLVKKCDLFISPDTGPMYIASSFGKKTITLFGSTDPSKYGPFDIQKHKIIYKKLQCSPCYKNFCPLVKKGQYSKCMELVSADEVISLLNKLRNL